MDQVESNLSTRHVAKQCQMRGGGFNPTWLIAFSQVNSRYCYLVL